MEWKLPVLLLLLFGLASISESKEVTHEDIKEAILNMAHLIRADTEKLERHEARERLLGEQLKKSISLLAKRLSTIDTFKMYLVKLDERVGGIEQLIAQRDERERVQIQKTENTLEDIQNRLEGWAIDIETKIAESVSRSGPSSSSLNKIPELLQKLSDSGATVAEKVAILESNLNSISKTLKEDEFKNVVTEVKVVGEKVRDIETGLQHLKEASPKSENSETFVYPLIGEQTRMLDQVHTLIQNTLDHVRDLPRVLEFQSLYNQSQTSLVEATHQVLDAVSSRGNAVENKLSEVKEEIHDAVNSLKYDINASTDRLNGELQDLEKSQAVMVSMADHVLDTKKRVEHAYTILREVGHLVTTQGMTLNTTLNSRFDGISNDIMDNQNGALANLTVKMEQEMNQVWRQINVMYQQMMESAKALDKLHKQNEVYVNGTTTTMDGMESKVSEITSRMTEVDTNLNYLLGRLSLVTQEFNQIKLGLGAALDNIKASFKEVQQKANDLSSPGPHPVPQNYTELDEPQSGQTEGTHEGSEVDGRMPSN